MEKGIRLVIGNICVPLDSIITIKSEKLVAKGVNEAGDPEYFDSDYSKIMVTYCFNNEIYTICTNDMPHDLCFKLFIKTMHIIGGIGSFKDE